jgi:hypothetical protein
LSDDAIARSIGLYQTMRAARQQAPERLVGIYKDIEALVLTIDGLQPDKGHETLYVVRELMSKRVWCAAPLLSSATSEVHRLLVLARQWATRLAKPVRGWMSDKQEAFVQAIAAEFPDPPHRYGQNHFLRDVAKPMLAMDSRAKGQRRRKVRGLRAIERQVLDERRHTMAPHPHPLPARPKTEDLPLGIHPEAALPTPRVASDGGGVGADSALEAVGVTPAAAPGGADEAGEVVLGYCAAVRGILNDDQGGPLHPPGLRMREALQDVRDSLERHLCAQKGGQQRRC